MEIEQPAVAQTTNTKQARNDLTDEELYLKAKELQNEIELLKIQEDFIKEEQKNLKKELMRAREEIKKIQAVPLVIGQFVEMIDVNHGKTGNQRFRNLLWTVFGGE